MTEADHWADHWVLYDVATRTYITRDGTVVAAELIDNVQCLADVLHIANIRARQRKMKEAESPDGQSSAPPPAT